MQSGKTCPECGKDMMTGSACVMSFAAGMTWHDGRSTLALGGETLVSGLLGRTIWLDGYRCPNCRLLLVHSEKRAKLL